MRVNENIDGWVVIGSEPGVRQLAFQRATDWVPPRWPDPAYPQQLHLDIRVTDAEQANRNCSPSAPLAYEPNVRRASGSLPTPPVTRSASSSVTTAHADVSQDGGWRLHQRR